MTPEELWWRPNASTVSAGNLLLHLDGNVRQWILGGLGGRPVDRDRDGEFSATGPVAGDELIARLRATLDEAAEVLEGLDPAGLAEPRRIRARTSSPTTTTRPTGTSMSTSEGRG
jgi:hypothetical protein